MHSDARTEERGVVLGPSLGIVRRPHRSESFAAAWLTLVPLRRHYCHALRKYTKAHILHVISLGGWGIMVSSDDKATVNCGGPNHPQSTCTRAVRKSLVAKVPVQPEPVQNAIAPDATMAQRLNAGDSLMDGAEDHTFGIEQVKVCVNLMVRTPARVEDSWFAGDVSIHLREGVFGQSTGLLHAAELCVDLLRAATGRLWRTQGGVHKADNRWDVDLPKDAQGCPTVETLPAFEALPSATQSSIRGCLPAFLAISTDGGSDHNNLQLGNQVALWLIQEYLRIPSVVRTRSISSAQTVCQIL
jgi:hypothetical protein